MSSAFVIFGLGISLAVLVFLLELIYKRCKDHYFDHNTVTPFTSDDLATIANPLNTSIKAALPAVQPTIKTDSEEEIIHQQVPIYNSQQKHSNANTKHRLQIASHRHRPEATVAFNSNKQFDMDLIEILEEEEL